MASKRGGWGDVFRVLGALVGRFPWLVLGFWVVASVVAAPGASRVGEDLSAESEVPAGSESGEVSRLLAGEFPGRDQERLVLAIRASDGAPRVGDGAFEEAVDGAVGAIEDVPGVGRVVTPREEGPVGLAKEGGREAAVLIGLETGGSAQAQALVGEVREELAGVERPEGVVFYLTGNPAVFLDTAELSDRDVARAETTALPLTLLMLVVAFGALVAALLPLVVGVASIFVSLGALSLVTGVMPVSIFAQSVITLLGLAVGIDYSLLMVNRFREELARGRAPREAAAVTAATAGRTVVFSGSTVAASLAALLIPPVEVVRSIGISGLIVVLVAVCVSTTAVPAMLALLGERVNAPRLLFRLTAWTRGEEGWRRLADSVLGRPVLFALAVVALLLALALPLRGAVVYNPGELALGEEAESRQGIEVLKDLGVGGTLDTVDVLVDLGEGESLYGSPAAVGDVHRLAGELEGTPGVEAVTSPTPTGPQGVPLPLLERLYASEAAAEDGPIAGLADATVGGSGRYVLFEVTPEDRLRHEEVRPFVERVEDEAWAAMPEGAKVLVGGTPVENLDYARSIYGSFPVAVVAVFATTFVLLVLAFRSVFVPLLSIGTNALTVGAALGLLTLVFQEGYGGTLLGLPGGGLGTLEEIVPITVFAVTFGLSMDYQVFLLSRVQEHRLSGRGTADSVSGALVSTGRVISFAALIMLVVFGAFLLSGLSSVQALGFGLAATVLLDATLVRLVLVPAVLKLAGEGGWWLPGWLDRALPNIHFEGEPPGDLPSQQTTTERSGVVESEHRIGGR